ncbi:MAG: hypothetical protein AVDCRST_MAG77-5243, partial [uncultured Chloroflexi bacterium]
ETNRLGAEALFRAAARHRDGAAEGAATGADRRTGTGRRRRAAQGGHGGAAHIRHRRWKRRHHRGGLASGHGRTARRTRADSL